MNIREADLNDTPAIAKVTVDTWKTAYRGIIVQRYLDNLSYQDREKGWRQFPFSNLSFIFVAENEHKDIIGFAAAGPAREPDLGCSGELYAIYIDQSHQNSGIGSDLFRAVAKKFWQSGIKSICLWVLSNSPYRRFYECHGGQFQESKLLDMEGSQYDISAYIWPDIRELLESNEID